MHQAFSKLCANKHSYRYNYYTNLISINTLKFCNIYIGQPEVELVRCSLQPGRIVQPAWGSVLYGACSGLAGGACLDVPAGVGLTAGGGGEAVLAAVALLAPPNFPVPAMRLHRLGHAGRPLVRLQHGRHRLPALLSTAAPQDSHASPLK